MSAVTVTVKSAGRALPPDLALVSVDVRRALNRLPSAQLVLLDGDAATGSFSASDGSLFKLGAEIEILARYEGSPGQAGQDQRLFKGLVVRRAIDAGLQGATLRVDLRDKAVKLTRPRRSRVLVDTTDSDAMGALAQEAGLPATVDATQPAHPSLVQYDCSDWDWLLTRAEANGLVVAVHDGALTVTRPTRQGRASLRFTWGLDEILNLALECDALEQDDGAVARHWDTADQKTATTDADAPQAPGQGSVTGAKAAQALGFGKASLLHGAALLPAEAKAWADGQALRNALGLMRGCVRVQGVGTPRLLDVLAIDGVGDAFSGEVLLTGLCHQIDTRGWTTDLQIGLPTALHHRRADLASAGAAGLLPPVAGLHIGVVAAVHDDPQSEHRVQVTVPALGDKAPALWARLATPDAGKDRGLHLRPEVGDEVVLGFFHDDPRQPVVLGSLYGSKNAPPAAVVDASDKNALRGFVSRSGLTLAMDDEKKQLSLQMPSGAQLLMNDDSEAIVISDKHGNKITLDKNGVGIVSAKDFNLDAGSGNVTAKGSKIDLN